jgi:hypothetical protein
VARALDPAITLIVDPDDDLESLEQLRRLHARPFGQLLCEPDPTAASAELARYILQALGKHSEAGTRGELWAQVDCHLRTERVRELVIARAQTLTFASLRDLANHAHDAGTAVCLLIAAERPPPAIAQLLEMRPHETADIRDLISRWTGTEPPARPAIVPPGAGSDYPYITPVRTGKPLTRSWLCARLKRHERALVNRTWKTTHSWIAGWLDDHPDCTDGELADAIYTVTAAGDTPSEMLVRAQATIVAAHSEGIQINRDLFAHDCRLGFTETRPSEWRHAVERAAALIDEIADPQLAATLALSVVYRRATSIRRVTINGVAPNGAIAYSDYAGLRAIPPQLRPALQAQREQLTRAGDAPHAPFLPGKTGGRMAAERIERALEALDLPRAVWDGTDDEYFDPVDLDGRAILQQLDPISLFDPGAIAKSCRNPLTTAVAIH